MILNEAQYLTEKLLKHKINFKKLDKIAYTNSDNEFAEILRKEKRKLLMKTIKIVFILAFVFSLSLFLLHYKIVGKAVYGDGVYYYSYLRSLVIDHDLNFSNELAYFNQPLTLTKIGKIANKFSFGAPLLWMPFFILGHWVGSLLNIFGFNLALDGYSDIYQIFVGLGAVIYGFLGILICFSIMKKFFSSGISLLAAAFIWLATNLFFYTSIDLINSHSASFFTASLLVYFWLKRFKKRTNVRTIILGLLISFLAMIRVQDIIIGLPVILKELKAKQSLSNKILLFVFIFLGFLPQLFIWKFLFGEFRSPYLILNGKFNWLKPSILAVLFSSKNGLFFYSPILIFSLIGLIYLLKKHFWLGFSGWLVFFLQLYLISSWSIWWGGASYGARMFISLAPFFMLGFGAFINHLSQQKRKFFYFFGIGLVILNFSLIIRFLALN